MLLSRASFDKYIRQEKSVDEKQIGLIPFTFYQNDTKCITSVPHKRED